jgi:hypothetical protein
MMIQKKGFHVPLDCKLNECFDNEDCIDVVFTKRELLDSTAHSAKRRRIDRSPKKVSNKGEQEGESDSTHSAIERIVESQLLSTEEGDNEKPTDSIPDADQYPRDLEDSEGAEVGTQEQAQVSDSETQSSSVSSTSQEWSAPTRNQEIEDDTRSMDSRKMVWPNQEECAASGDSKEAENVEYNGTDGQGVISPNSEVEPVALTVEEESSGVSVDRTTAVTKKNVKKKARKKKQSSPTQAQPPPAQDASIGEQTHESMNELLDSQDSVQFVKSYSLKVPASVPQLSGLTQSSPIQKVIPDSEAEQSPKKTSPVMSFSPLFSESQKSEVAKRPVAKLNAASMKKPLPAAAIVPPSSIGRRKFQRLSDISLSQPLPATIAPKPIEHHSTSTDSVTSTSDDSSSSSENEVQIAGKKKKRRKSLLLEMAKDCESR